MTWQMKFVRVVFAVGVLGALTLASTAFGWADCGFLFSL
jgi:hypothetical protein